MVRTVQRSKGMAVRPILFLALVLLVALPLPAAAQLSANVSVYAIGLDNPRGLTFGPDGLLYVAEAGTGGSDTTVGLCPELQIGPPYGPYTSGRTARISRIDAAGTRTTLLGGLPSGQSLVPDWQGVADVAFIGSRLYALIQGGGCSYGEAVIPKGIVEVDPDSQTFQFVVDLGAFRRANPPSLGDDDLEPEGVFYAMTEHGGRLYVLDANSSVVLEVTRKGEIKRRVDLTEALGQHITPTAVVWDKGGLHIANLFEFPIVDGASAVYRVKLNGQVETVEEGLTAVTGLAVDQRGRLYVLETGNGQGSGFPDPGAGRILRIDRSGARQVIATGFTFPTAMTLGPDGQLYVSNRGFDIPPAGTGEILAVKLPD